MTAATKSQLILPTVKVESLPSNLLEVKIDRNSFADGILVSMKSEVFEKFFRSNCTHKELRTDPDNPAHKPLFQTSRNHGWEGLWAYPINEMSELQDFRAWGHSFYIEGRGPNLSYLRAYGLSQGIQFNIPGLYSTEKLNQWKEQAKQKLVEFYKNYMKKLEISLIVVMTEVNT